jgi:hypothetical protein
LTAARISIFLAVGFFLDVIYTGGFLEKKNRNDKAVFLFASSRPATEIRTGA